MCGARPDWEAREQDSDETTSVVSSIATEKTYVDDQPVQDPGRDASPEPFDGDCDEHKNTYFLGCDKCRLSTSYKFSIDDV